MWGLTVDGTIIPTLFQIHAPFRRSRKTATATPNRNGSGAKRRCWFLLCVCGASARGFAKWGALVCSDAGTFKHVRSARQTD